MISTNNKTVRCAVYTRRSPGENLQLDFNSLDAQHEAGEAHIISQKHSGWMRLSKHCDDGGYTGWNVDCPAFQRLMDDIEAGRQCAVYASGLTGKTTKTRLTRDLHDPSDSYQPARCLLKLPWQYMVSCGETVRVWGGMHDGWNASQTVD